MVLRDRVSFTVIVASAPPWVEYVAPVIGNGGLVSPDCFVPLGSILVMQREPDEAPLGDNVIRLGGAK